MRNQYRLLKLLGASLSVLFGLVQIRYLSIYYNESAALLLTLLSLYVYLSFFDLGLTKPIYAELRSKYISKGAKETKSYTWLFLALSLIVFVIGYLLILVVSSIFEREVSGIAVVFLAISFSCSLYFLFLRAVFEAFDRHFLIESIDVIRKISLILITLIIPYIDSYWVYFTLFGTINMIIVIISIAILIRYCSISSFNLYQLKHDLNNVRSDGFHNLTYSAADMLVNNSGIIMVPILFTDKYVIAYHLWLKLYRGLSVIYRSIMDADLPDISRLFFQSRRNEIKLKAYRLIILCLLIAFALDIFLYLGSSRLFQLFNINESLDLKKSFYFISLFVLLSANIIQHRVAGIMLILGGSYYKLKVIALVIFCVTLVFLLVAKLLQVSLVVFLVSMSVIMLGSAFLHLGYFNRLMNDERS